MPRRQIQYLKVNDAASFLGVSRSTIRAWDRSGRLKAKRQGNNRYRLYRFSELRKFKEERKPRKYNKMKR